MEEACAKHATVERVSMLMLVPPRHASMPQVQPMCKTWLYERAVQAPKNLYDAQKKLRKQAARKAAKNAGSR